MSWLCVLCNVTQVGQEIEVRPGIVTRDLEGKLSCQPIFSRIVSLYAEQNDLQYAVPGGLIGTVMLLVVVFTHCTRWPDYLTSGDFLHTVPGGLTTLPVVYMVYLVA